jgi:hypothetical protein
MPPEIFDSLESPEASPEPYTPWGPEEDEDEDEDEEEIEEEGRVEYGGVEFGAGVVEAEGEERIEYQPIEAEGEPKEEEPEEGSLLAVVRDLERNRPQRTSTVSMGRESLSLTSQPLDGRRESSQITHNLRRESFPLSIERISPRRIRTPSAKAASNNSVPKKRNARHRSSARYIPGGSGGGGKWVSEDGTEVAVNGSGKKPASSGYDKRHLRERVLPEVRRLYSEGQLSQSSKDKNGRRPQVKPKEWARKASAPQSSNSTPGSNIPTVRRTSSVNGPGNVITTRHMSKKRSHDTFAKDAPAVSKEPKRPKLERLENERQALVRSIVRKLDRQALEDIMVAAGLKHASVMSDIIAGNAGPAHKTREPESDDGEEELEDELHESQYNDDDKYQDYPPASLSDDENPHEMPISGTIVVDDDPLPEDPFQPTRPTKTRAKTSYTRPSRITPPIIDPTWHIPTSGTVPVGILKGHPNVVTAGFDKRMTFNWRISKYDREGRVVGQPVERKGKGPATRREHVELHPSLKGLGQQEFYKEVLRRQWGNEGEGDD